MKKVKTNGCVLASMYFSNTIKIPYSRLATMLKPGDIIRGYCHKVSLSANYVEYRVTHIDWWGVFAVPTENMIENMYKDRKKEFVDKIKGHHKFKWNHINGVIFNKE